MAAIITRNALSYNKAMKTMQKIATRVFIGASILFGILGITMALTGIDPGSHGNTFEIVIGKLFLITIFTILPSFALSVAGKYLGR